MDVVVVGGGFAGLSVASHLCTSSDLEVILFEKGSVGDPSKTSAASFVDAITKFKLSDSIEQLYRKYVLRSESGLYAYFEIDKPVLALIDYKKACEILVDRAKSRNFELYEKMPVLDFYFKDSNTIEVITPGYTVRTKVLVDATGSSFFCGKKLGLKLPTFFEHAYGYVLESDEIKSFDEFCLFGGEHSPGGGWFYPTANGVAKFGCCVGSHSTNFPEEVLRSNLKYLLETLEPYNHVFKRARVLRVEKGTIPLGPVRNLVYKRVMFVGDSAGMATPWAAEGLRPALEAGKLCAEAIIRAFENEKDFDSYIKLYQHMWNKLCRKIYLSNMRWSKIKYKLNNEGWDSIVKKYQRYDTEKVIKRLKTGEGVTKSKLIKIIILTMKLKLDHILKRSIFEEV